MKAVLRIYDKAWFVTGLAFMVLGFFRPEEYWYLTLLIPLVTVLITLASKRQLSERTGEVKADKNQFLHMRSIIKAST